MVEAPKSTSVTQNRKFPLITGLAIGLALPAAQAAERNLEPNLGYWGAVGVGAMAAAGVAVLVSLALSWLLKPRASGRV